MSDFLLELSQNPTAKKFIQAAGLPLPLPTPLERPKGATTEQILKDQPVIVGGDGELTELLAQIVVQAGAEPFVQGDKLFKAFESVGEAYGRRPTKLVADEMPAGVKGKVFVFDATSLKTPADLRQIYDFLKPRARAVAKSGRVIIIARPTDEAKTPAEAAARAGIDGFVRSLGKELGGGGATANVLYVQEGAEPRLAAALRFFMSSASAFVTLQPVRVTKLAKGEAATSFAKPLAGKVVMVTGAARGIGAATAEVLAAEGAHVVVLDRPADDQPAAETAKKVGGTVLLADVSDPKAPEQISKFLKDKFGGVDVVIHNAGITRDKMFANMKPDVWDMTVDINLSAVIRINEALISGGVLRDGGRIICLASISGIAGNAGQTNYSASKGGLIGYVKALAPTLAARGITVNAIAPGFIETRMTAAIPVAIREVARRLSALSQGGQPSDVGQALTFLSTPGAIGVTGQVLRVCGGAFVGGEGAIRGRDGRVLGRSLRRTEYASVAPYGRALVPTTSRAFRPAWGPCKVARRDRECASLRSPEHALRFARRSRRLARQGVRWRLDSERGLSGGGRDNLRRELFWARGGGWHLLGDLSSGRRGIAMTNPTDGHESKAAAIARSKQQMQSELHGQAFSAREKVALVCRILHRHGHESGLSGQVTARQVDGTYLTQRLGLGLREVQASNLLCVDSQLNVLSGDGMANPANRFHSWIYRVRPDVHCIVHTHPLHTSALSMIGEPLVIAHMDCCTLYDNVSFLPEWPGVPVGDEEGRIISEALGARSAALLAHHGLVVAARSIEEGCLLALQFERAAQLYLLARAAGPVQAIPADLGREARDWLSTPRRIEATFAYHARAAIAADPACLA